MAVYEQSNPHLCSKMLSGVWILDLPMAFHWLLVDDLWSVSVPKSYITTSCYVTSLHFFICMEVYWDIPTIEIGHCSVVELQKSVGGFSAQLFSMLSYYKAYFPLGVVIQYLSIQHCWHQILMKKLFHNCWVLVMVQWHWTITYL